MSAHIRDYDYRILNQVRINMSAVARDRLQKARRLAAAINDDLQRATALDAAYRRAIFSKDVPRAFNNTYEAHILSVVRNALLCELVMVLMRIYDTDTGSASLPNLRSLLADINVRRLIHENCKLRAGFGDRSPVSGRPIDDPQNAAYYEREFADRK
jgi:hypothetical protein